MKVLVIIPSYNEESNIERVVENLINNYNEYDYIIINDGSQDKTLEICKERGYNYIDLPFNLGIGGSVQTGYLYAVSHGYDIAIQMDGDGQHNPEYIKLLIEPIVDGQADLVTGSRFLEGEGFQTSCMRRFGIRILRCVIRFCCGYRATDATSGFRATSKKLTRFYCGQYAQDYPEPEAIVSASLRGFRLRDMPVKMSERDGGLSSISGLWSVHYMLKVSLALLFYRIGTRRIKV